MSDSLDWKKVVEGLTSRVNVLEEKVKKLEANADTAKAYMEVASKIAARNYQIIQGHAAYAAAPDETPLDPSIPVWQR